MYVLNVLYRFHYAISIQTFVFLLQYYLFILKDMESIAVCKRYDRIMEQIRKSEKNNFVRLILYAGDKTNKDFHSRSYCLMILGFV